MAAHYGAVGARAHVLFSVTQAAYECLPDLTRLSNSDKTHELIR